MTEGGDMNLEGSINIGENYDDSDDDIKIDAGNTPGNDINNIISNNNNEMISNDSDNEIIINTNKLELDLCVLCDVTDSMTKWIKTIKQEIISLTNQLKSDYNINNIRLSFVGYRDWSDDNNRIQVLNFTSNTIKYENYIDKIRCFGGDDICEDVLGGLNTIFKLKWNTVNKKCVKLIYHILDAPPHFFF